jgi:hypothetical protein
MSANRISVKNNRSHDQTTNPLKEKQVRCCQQAEALIDRIADGLSPIRTLHPFWGNFRVGGDTKALPVQRTVQIA